MSEMMEMARAKKLNKAREELKRVKEMHTSAAQLARLLGERAAVLEVIIEKGEQDV